MDRDHVGVAQRRRRARLVDEPLDDARVRGVVGVEQLDRDVAPQSGVLGQVDRAHPTLAELADDAVPAEQIAGSEHAASLSSPARGRDHGR
jgi:hypothetical protein